MDYAEHLIISENFYDSALNLVISAICYDEGFHAIQNSATHIILQIIQKFFYTVAHVSKSFCELSGRTNISINDIHMAFDQIGMDIQSLTTYFHEFKMIKLTLNTPTTSNDLKCLQVGQRNQLPSYIPQNFPQYPDLYTFKRTNTSRSVSNGYQLIREKCASQKRDIQIAFTRYIAKIGDTENLFPDDPYAFPLISTKPKSLPYLEALLCSDIEDAQDEDGKTSTRDPSTQQLQPAILETQHSQIENGPINNGSNDIDYKQKNMIDNPYLRPIKMPKLKSIFNL